MRTWLVIWIAILFAGAAAAEPARPVYECSIEGVITVYSADFLDRAIREAAERNAEALVVRLDTPGGILGPTRHMMQALLNAPLPIVVYVSPRGASATSAGALLAISAHVIAMAPGTNIGAAHPVLAIPVDTGEKTSALMEKVVNDVVANAKSIASVRGRNLDWVEKAIRKSVSSTAEEALQAKAIDLIVEDTAALLAALEGRQVKLSEKSAVVLRTRQSPVVRIEQTAREKLYGTVADPNVTYLALMLGVAAIAFEVTHPGFGLPGVAGVLAIGCALIGFKALPLSWTGLLMLVCGLAFLVLEVKAGGHGVLGLGGLACLGVGSYLLFDAGPALRVSTEYIVSVVGTLGFLFLVLMAQVFRDMRRPPVSGREGMIGQAARAREDFQDEGLVMAEGEIWKALNRGKSKIVSGDQVRILAVREGLLEVERID